MKCSELWVPEEINRCIVGDTSDINLIYSKIARDYLLHEGLPADQIICAGSPMREVLDYCADDIAASTSRKSKSLMTKLSGFRNEVQSDVSRKVVRIIHSYTDIVN